MNAVARRHLPFPIAEGVGIFLGIVAWDVLTVGQMELLNASLLAAAASMVWYGLRRWSGSSRRNPD